MTELELTRAPDDRRLYLLGEVGRVRLEGLLSRSATLEAGGRRWRAAPRGVWRGTAVVRDESGAQVGEFRPGGMRRGGTLRWGGRELGLRPASSWRERYVLVEGGRELALLDGRGWGRRPVGVALPDPGAVEPALVLFAAFVVRSLAETAAAAAASVTTTGV